MTRSSTPTPPVRGAALAALALVAGCGGGAGEPAAQADPWSTKGQSALYSDGGPALHLTVSAGALSADDALRAAALDLLAQAGTADQPVLRANALEALYAVPDQAGPHVRRGLTDPNRGVRFVAAMIIGKLRMLESAPLLEPLLDDDSRSVRAAAIYGMRRCGRPVDLNPLAEMLRDPDPEVKSNAILVLGELGNRSAVPLIRSAVVRRSHLPPVRAKLIDLQIAESLVKLGEGAEVEPIRAALFSSTGEEEVAAVACMMLGRLGDRAYIGTLLEIARRTGARQEPVELRLAAAAAVARIDPARAPVEVVLEYVGHEQPLVRSQAALALGQIGDRTYLDRVGPMMQDPDPLVQVAAAAAVLRLPG